MFVHLNFIFLIALKIELILIDPDGLVGPLKINGPSSMNYDVDLGPVLLTDWFHKDAFSQVQLEYLGKVFT